MEASHRPKQAQHFSTRRKVQNGNSRVHQDLLIPGEWVSLIDLSDTYLHIPIHPNSRKYLRFCYKSQVFQFTSLPFRLATAPQVFTMIVKEVKLMALSRGLRIHQYLDDWLIRSQSQEEAQVNTQAVVDLTQSLGWIINQEKLELKPTQVFFVHGLRIPPRFSPCKTHSREMAQTSGFDPTTQVKTCFDCKMFDVSNWVASLNGENGPGGTPSHEALSVSSQGALEISSVAGQPPSLDRSHCSPPRLVAKSLKRDERCRPSSQRPQYPTLYQRLKRRLGHSLRSKFHKGSVVRSGKKATHKCPRIEGGLPGPSRLQGPVPESNSVSCDGQLNSGSLHQQTRHVLGCLNVMADLLSRSNQVQSTEWSLHPQVFKQICQKWFTPHVDLFATHLNHKLPLYVSLIPDPRAWDIDARNINWTNLTAYAYPPTAPSQGDPKDQAMLLPDHRNSPRLARDGLVLGPSAALNRDPTTTPSVNNPTQTVPQVCVPQQPPAPEPPRLVSRSGQLQEQGFSVEVAERIAAPQRSSPRTIYKSKWALFKKWCRENSVDFSTPSVKQISDFFMYLYQDLNRRPSTFDGYRTAIVDTLGPTAQHVAHNADLHRLLSSFHRDRPKSSRYLPKWNLSVVLNELTKVQFEPMKDTDLKHLTLKTAFLLALASSKRRSEIHAWVANKVSNLGQWEKVALFPSSDFIAKNQLAREGSQSVSPVTIPALTTIVDR